MVDILGPSGVLALLVLGGMIGFVVLLRYPEVMLAILLVGQGFIHLAFTLMGMEVNRLTFAVAGTVLFLPVVILMIMGRILGIGRRQDEPPLFGRTSGLFIIVLIGVGILLWAGLAYTSAPTYGEKKFREFLTFGVGPFFLAFLFIRDLKAVRRLMWWIMLMAGFFVMVSLIYNYQATGGLFTAARYAKTAHLGPFAVYSGVELGVRTSIFFVTLIMVAWSARNKAWRMVASVPLLFLTASVVSAGARSALLAMFAMVAVTLKMLYRGRWGVPLMTAGALILVMIGYFVWAPESAKARFVEPLTGTGSAAMSTTYRLGSYRIALGMIAEKPLLGYGTGGFAVEQSGRDMELFAHNMWLNIWAENGVLGFVLVSTLWVLVAIHLWRRYRSAPWGSPVFYAVIWVTGLLVEELSTSMVEYDIAQAASMFVLISGIALKIVALADHEAKRQRVGSDGTLKPVELLVQARA